MKNDATQDLYAQWYKQDGSSITVPGKDGDPNNEQTNVTGKGDGISRDLDTGVITIPNSGTITVTKPNGDKETILLPNGGTLNPDGSYSINLPGNNGKIDVDNNGNEKPKDDQGNVKPDVEIVTMTYRSNNGEDGVVNVKAIKGEDTALIANPFKWSGYKFLNWMGTDKKEYHPGDTVKAAEGEFFAQWYKQTDGGSGSGSIELPGKDGAIEAPNDKDNAIVTPGENGTLDGPKKPDGSIEVKDDEGTVTRPDPNDPNYPNGSKEDIKVPVGSVISPDGTVIKPDQKYPDEVISEQYVIVTYEPNGGIGNTLRQMVKKDEATQTLDGSLFTAPNGKTFDKWLDENNSKTYAAGDELSVGKNDITLKAQWKNVEPTPTTYSATIKFESNTDQAAVEQTLTSTTGVVISGKLDAYAEHFTAPEGWTFMGWSTAQAASQNATFYEDETTITLRDKDSLTLYAILYKKTDDGKVILPGKDGKPDPNTDNVTVAPAEGSTITPGKGYVEAPKYSTITLPDNKTITVVDGTVKVYPDGSIYVPDGNKVMLPDGTEVKGETTITPDGSENNDKNKPIQKPDGTIVLPGNTGAGGVANPTDTGVGSILNAADHGAYMTGYDSTTFAPDHAVTRAQVAQIFYNLLRDKSGSAASTFTDVPADAWYAKAVNTLSGLGIVSGVSGTTFEPDRAITRAEFTAIAARFAKASTAGTVAFTDASASAWYYANVQTAVFYGWLSGYADQSFRPNNTITRAEAATIVNRMLARSADTDFIGNNANVRRYGDVGTGHWAYAEIMEAVNAHDYTNANNKEVWSALK